ncbi:MAG: ABC-F family ATP-binding cassette domain-containing protein [Bacteroidales bacterium]|nr:ABC-F family ATP-binding cassette domain-containing protein [Bacteroidales bacterium]MCF8392111.1 ABC-F family ATP-binding cassette domain-containing protein [Bacteroidales bacterium]
MLLLSAENIEKNFGERVLFSNLSIGLSTGDKAALIAPNGTGKTSLLKILAGKDQPEKGSVVYAQDLRISLLDQEPEFNSSVSIKEQINQASTRITRIISNYNHAVAIHGKIPNASNQSKLNEAIAAMDISEAWDYERKLSEMLNRFAIVNLDQKIATLSGGQRKRLALALTLIDKPDILLLDEPTNHLDIDMIEWLESYLSHSKQSFLMVTHDRYFLDNACNIIFELEDKTIYTHEGNYELFLRNKAAREKAEDAEIQKARSYVRNELDWMRRMPKARTTKAKSRIDNFHEVLKKASSQKENLELKLEINMKRMGGKVLEIKNMSKSYAGKEIIKDFSYKFNKGERIGIIGANGSGKSTFLNLISGRIEADKGEKEIGETIVMSYYRQEGIEFDESKKVIEVLTDIAEVIETKKGNILSASQFLQHFMFPPKVQHQAVAKLSGGEKRRLYLLTILIRNPNFLILDEPTNDLDLLSLQKLEDFLLNFGGCLIIVSHDRFFLDKLCDHLFIFEEKAVIKDFYGSYTVYKDEKNQELALERNSKKEKTKSIQAEAKQVPKVKKGLSFKEKREFEDLENEIPALESEKDELEKLLNSGNSDYQELQKLSDRISKLMLIIDEKEQRWLELDELNQ